MATGRYFDGEALVSGGYVPVRGSMFEPVVPLGYDLEVAPSILPVPGPDTLGEWHPLRSAYWRQLDRAGVGAVAAELADISERHGGRPVLVLDYEDVAGRGHRSPRVVLGRWLTEKTGREVPEITAAGRRLSHAELHKQVRGRPRVAGEPLPEPLGLSWPLADGDLERWAASVPWRHARTMPDNPHAYAVRRDADDRDFDLVVLHIRERGYQRVFAGFEYTQLDAGGFTYWSMGDSLPTTLLINRKVVGQDEGEEEVGGATEALQAPVVAGVSPALDLFGEERA